MQAGSKNATLPTKRDICDVWFKSGTRPTTPICDPEKNRNAKRESHWLVILVTSGSKEEPDLHPLSVIQKKIGMRIGKVIGLSSS